MVTYYTSNIDNNLIFLIILEPRNTSSIWYLNTLANSLKLTFEMTTKFSQKVKIAWTAIFITIKFLENGLTIYLAAYITKHVTHVTHVTCGRPIYPPNKQKNSPPWGIGQKLRAVPIIPHDSSWFMLKA